MPDIRLCNRTQLREIAREAARRSYNRVLPDVEIDDMSDDTMIVVQPVLIHELAQGKPVEPHLRCIIKWGKDLELGGYQDVPFEMFDGLFKVEIDKPTEAAKVGKQ